MAPVFDVEARGIGKPDYSREVSAGRERAGMLLAYNQQFKVFVGGWGIADPLYPLCVDNPIPIGGQWHLTDADTLVPTPATLPRGFTLTIISIAFSTTEDMALYGFTDSIVCTNLGVSTGGQAIYENKIREFSTIWYDPTALIPHTLDIIAYNRGGGPLHGGAALLCIVEAVGTPPFPTTKNCRCPYCQHMQTVSVETTLITCDECGKDYMVTRYSTLRGL